MSTSFDPPWPWWKNAIVRVLGVYPKWCWNWPESQLQVLGSINYSANFYGLSFGRWFVGVIKLRYQPKQ